MWVPRIANQIQLHWNTEPVRVNPVVTLVPHYNTTHYTNLTRCTFPTDCVYEFHIIPKINTDYLPK